MRVACARRNESQASSPLPLGSSLATRRSSRRTTSADGTCIRNNQFGRVLALASIRRSNRMSITHPTDRYTGLPDDETLRATVVALEEHGFSVDVVSDLDAAREAARERIIEHSLKLEDARAYAAYGQNSRVGKVLEIHQEDPGRIHVVLIRQTVGY